jgi:hypothetical protein
VPPARDAGASTSMLVPCLPPTSLAAAARYSVPPSVTVVRAALGPRRKTSRSPAGSRTSRARRPARASSRVAEATTRPTRFPPRRTSTDRSAAGRRISPTAGPARSSKLMPGIVLARRASRARSERRRASCTSRRAAVAAARDPTEPSTPAYSWREDCNRVASCASARCSPLRRAKSANAHTPAASGSASSTIASVSRRRPARGIDRLRNWRRMPINSM